MYPRPDLSLLDQRKRALVHRIRLRREECATHLGVVLKPVSWVDGVRRKWSEVSPLAKMVAVPTGLFLAKKIMPRLGGLLGWAPLARTLFRAMR